MIPAVSELSTYALDDGVATIAMDDGKVNALSIAMLRELHAHFDRAESDDAVVVLTGREGYFSAGFDLKVFREQPENLGEMLVLGATLAERILAFPRPVVVAASGHAIAAGAFVPLPADLRIAADGDFKVGLNEVQIGLTLPQFVIELARARLATTHFDAATVSARMYDPAGAVEAGYFDRVVAPAELAGAAADAAQELKGLNAEAHKQTKLKARAPLIASLRAAIEAEFGSVELP